MAHSWTYAAHTALVASTGPRPPRLRARQHPGVRRAWIRPGSALLGPPDVLRNLLHRVVNRLGLAAALRDELRHELRRDIATLRGDIQSLEARVRKGTAVATSTRPESVEPVTRELETRMLTLAARFDNTRTKSEAGGLETQAAVAALQQQLTRLTRAYALDAEHFWRIETNGRWDAGRIASHVRQAVEAATLHTDPFPHIVVDGLLPADAFQVLADAIPPDDFFDGDDSRHLDLKSPERAIMPVSAKGVWTSFSRDIVRGALGPAVAARFRPLLRDYLRLSVGDELVDEAAALPLQTRGLRLMLRRPGWKLPPHLDPRDQFMTTLLYFPAPGDPEAHGTQLFRVDRKDFVASWANTYYPEAEGLRCELVKTVPFRRNLCLSFLNLGGAHGAELPADAGPPDMKRLAFQFYIGPDRTPLNTLIDRLDEERRTAWTRRVKKGDRERLGQAGVAGAER